MADIKDLDALVSQYVMEHDVIRLKKGGLRERTRQQHIRPMRAYSADISAAWEVVQKLGILVIPIADGTFFSLVGGEKGWNSPADLIQYLQTADFATGGAAVADSAPLSICLAALKAVQKRKAVNFEALGEFLAPTQDAHVH